MNKLYVCLTCWIFLFNGVCLYDKGDCNFPCMNSKYWTTTWFLVCLWRNLKYQFDSEEHVYFLGFVRGQCKAVLFATLKNLLRGAFTFLFSSKSPQISKFKFCGQELLFQMFFRFIHLAEQTKRPLVPDIFSVPKKLSLQKSCIWEKLFYFLQKCGEDIHPIQVSEMFTCEQLGLELVCSNVLWLCSKVLIA